MRWNSRGGLRVLVIGIQSETKDREAGSSQNYTDPRAQVKGVDANTVELAVTIGDN